MVKINHNNLQKKFFFLQSLPRSGNTLLSSLVNENKNIKITANSIVPEILFKIYSVKDHKIYQNFPDEDSVNDVLYNVFNLYYKNWESEFIIDRGPWGTPFNLYVLKKIFVERKFVIIYRPVLESLASCIKIENPTNKEESCDSLMDSDGMIGKYLWGIKNLIKEKEDFILIKYEDLIKNIENELNKIFNFLGIKNYSIDKNYIKQLSINNISYNDSVYYEGLHKIRTDKIEYKKIEIEKYLPKNIINKYSNLDI